MPFLCYIHRTGQAVPYFEVLAEQTEGGAKAHAARLLAERADALRAEIWDGERLLCTLQVQAVEPTAL